ncbi:non-ribosomal peptide synthetase [Thozetella sp. PMI_491]|nr:non-ribosomal peptide synthetase [Thozetella sp. PMI_491]
MIVEAGPRAVGVTSSLELDVERGDRLQSLGDTLGCSVAVILRVAYAVAAQAHIHTDSISLAVSNDDGDWRIWKKALASDTTLLELLQDDEAHGPDNLAALPALESGIRLAISVLSKETSVVKAWEGQRLQNLQKAIPEIEALTTVSPNPLTGGYLVSHTHLEDSLLAQRPSSILSTFARVLEDLLSNPSIQLTHIELLSDLDYQKCLSWKRDVPRAIERCVHDMIGEHVASAPSRPAVDAWDGCLTYAQLDEAATAVAYQLTQKGVSPGSPVALCFEKSMWYIVANLGILKAGAAFVPLDPSQPEERLRAIVQQTRTAVVLSSKTMAQVAEKLSEEVVVVEHTSLNNVSLPQGWTPRSTTPWSLAYIMFTSGSTGNPKGVMIDHIAACSSAVYHGRATGVGKDTRALQFARPTFDASICEIITPLIHGGCVVVPSEEERMNNITDVIREKHANWSFFTPSLIRLLDPAEVPGLHTLVLGGEAVAQDNIDQWAPGRNLINGYGPTENTVFSVMCALPPTAKAGQIGRGVGSVCWIADPANPNRLMPPGSTGELLLEGPQLARGYLGFGEGEGPNAAFIRDPPWLVRQGRRGRLYRTGDLCRFDRDGNIYYEGRKDTQLKISGQRLEAGEVEHHLRAAFGTPHIAVDVIERPGAESNSAQSKVLVAYVCLENSEDDTATNSRALLPRQDPKLAGMIPQVEDQLAKILPRWMIPSVYLPLRTFPLGVNGKADVKRLRAEASSLSVHDISAFMLDTPEPAGMDTSESPRLQLLRNLWVGVLGLEPTLVSRKSSFFRLGGDSITAMRLVAAARKAGHSITVAGIFRNPTLEDQCDLLREESDDLAEAIPRVDQYELLPEWDTVNMLREIAQECGILPDNIEDAYPCTPLQEGFMALTTSETPYIAQHIMHLTPEVQVERLKTAWGTVAKAHGILRTRIVNVLDAGMVQVVVDEELEWGEASDLASYLEQDMAKPSGFGIPLNRFGIIRGPDGQASHLVWSGHHAVIDGHSVGLTLRAVRDAYHGSIHPPVATFANFIKSIVDIDTEAAAVYWRAKFSNPEFTTFPKLPSASYVPRPCSYIQRSIKARSQNLGITSSTVLRAAWALVISLFTGSHDVVFGVTSTGRNNVVKHLESIFGPTIATVPLRVKCGKETTVLQLLEETQLGGIDMIPFEQAGLQSISRLGTDCHAACAFQSLLIVQADVDMGLGDSLFGDFEKPQDLDAFNSYSIMVECSLGNEGDVHVNANYDSAVIEDAHISRLVDYLEAAVAFLCSEGAQTRPLEDFFGDLLPADIDKIRKWNSSEPQVVRSCIHKLFEQQVEIQPEKEAIFSWDGCLNFRQLDDWASRLARKLVDLGVGPEVQVPYCFEKSKFTVVAMLAILKAGGAMVPLDPAHPEERKRFILDKIGAKVVTASNTNAPKFENLGRLVITVNQELMETLEQENVAPFSSTEVSPRNAASILFTSGSTGTPKGVVQEHQTLASAAYGESGPMLMTSSSRILQFSAHVFDVSIIEIVNSLVLGATLCIPSESDRTGNLAAFVTRSRADWAFFTPSFASTLRPADLPTMRTVNLGGEAVDRESIATWANSVTLVNAYGPCEAAVCVTTNLSDGTAPADTIGFGANCLTWLVDQDDHDKLIPVGSVGELLLEGPNVARGYHDDDEKTTKAFITNPEWMSRFETSGRSRVLYKTGDLGRYNPDGSVVYLGRKDTQVKIRGQRVELGEIEYHLGASLPQGSVVAADAIVLPGSAAKALVAFVRLGHQGEHSQAEQTAIIGGLSEKLKQQLGAVLPVYMIPSAFIPVDKMPFTSTGKLDRKALREHASSISPSELHALVSSNGRNSGPEKLEDSEEVAMAISRVLVDQLFSTDPEYGSTLRGRNFNPYQAGMDSIQVISLSTFVRKTYGVSIPVQKYMTSSATIRDIAGWVMSAKQRRVAEMEPTSAAENTDFLKEIEKYDAEIAKHTLPGTVTPPKEIPEIVLVTGATGFLGSQIMAQLLQRSATRKVIALVRGRDPAHATARLLSVGKSNPWWQDDYAGRIEVWHGDLALPRLGLDNSQWDRLCHRNADLADDVDAIIHNGAVVHWLADYTALTPANIVSTADLLHAISEAASIPGRPVPRFTYVSGGHLSTAPDNVGEIAKEMNTSAYPAYSQTKFVAENLVAKLAARHSAHNLPQSISIVKPPLIMGDSVDGIANTDDFLWRVTASALDSGMYNGSENDMWLAAAGVDLVARTVLASCLDNGDVRVTIKKVLCGITVGEFWSIVMEETGRAIDQVEAKKWVSSMREYVSEIGKTHRLWPVLHFLDEKGVLGQPLNGLSEEEQREEQEAVKMALRKSLRYLVAIGYMQSSSGTNSDDEEGSMTRSSLLTQSSSVFARTPTTPSWELVKSSPENSAVSKDLPAMMTPLRVPSPTSDPAAARQQGEYFEIKIT